MKVQDLKQAGGTLAVAFAAATAMSVFGIEAAMAGLPGVEEIRSVSLFGLSFVSVYFKDDVDIYFARRLVGEKLQEVKSRLPQGYGEPVLGPNSSGLGQVFWYTVESADQKFARHCRRSPAKDPNRWRRGIDPIPQSPGPA